MSGEKTEQRSHLYPKWVGALLALIFPGAAHFISGERFSGIVLYLLVALFGISSVILLGMPFELAVPIAVCFFIISLILWGWVLIQSYRGVRKIGFKGWIILISILISLNILTRYFTKSVVEVFNISGSDMAPTLLGNKKDRYGRVIHNSGDRLVVEKISYHFSDPKRGELAVFHTDKCAPYMKGQFFIKRVVALPGERVSIRPPYIFINGRRLTEPSIFKKISEEMGGYVLDGRLDDSASEVTLAPDEYFVMGDNSKLSFDSRFFGPVERDQFIGKAVRIIWPPDRIRLFLDK